MYCKCVIQEASAKTPKDIPLQVQQLHPHGGICHPERPRTARKVRSQDTWFLLEMHRPQLLELSQGICSAGQPKRSSQTDAHYAPWYGRRRRKRLEKPDGRQRKIRKVRYFYTWASLKGSLLDAPLEGWFFRANRRRNSVSVERQGPEA